MNSRSASVAASTSAPSVIRGLPPSNVSVEATTQSPTSVAMRAEWLRPSTAWTSRGRSDSVMVASEALAGQTALLTVSFDVEYDTPAVLRAYGLPFQKTKPPFSHWRLASGRLDEVRRLGKALGLDFREEDRSFTHNLRTAVIGPDGTLFRLHRGNDWSPEGLLTDLRASLRP